MTPPSLLVLALLATAGHSQPTARVAAPGGVGARGHGSPGPATARLNDREYCDACKALLERIHLHLSRRLRDQVRRSSGGRGKVEADGNAVLHPSFCEDGAVKRGDAQHVRIGCVAMLRDESRRRVLMEALRSQSGAAGDSSSNVPTIVAPGAGGGGGQVRTEFQAGSLSSVLDLKRRVCVDELGACAPRDLKPYAGPPQEEEAAAAAASSSGSRVSGCDLCRRVASDVWDGLGRIKAHKRAERLAGVMEAACEHAAMRHDRPASVEEACLSLVEEDEDRGGAVRRALLDLPPETFDVSSGAGRSVAVEAACRVSGACGAKKKKKKESNKRRSEL